jgi:hypothetical protein
VRWAILSAAGIDGSLEGIQPTLEGSGWFTGHTSFETLYGDIKTTDFEDGSTLYILVPSGDACLSASRNEGTGNNRPWWAVPLLCGWLCWPRWNLPSSGQSDACGYWRWPSIYPPTRLYYTYSPGDNTISPALPKARKKFCKCYRQFQSNVYGVSLSGMLSPTNSQNNKNPLYYTSPEESITQFQSFLVTLHLYSLVV